MFAVKHSRFLIATICGILPALLVAAQEPLLLVSGLPCPGGQSEATNGHPLIWNCVCATEKGLHHDWWDWQASVPVHYGDVVAATWHNQCRAHTADWDFLRLDLVVTNGSGVYETNTSMVKMKAGYNFALCYVYWYTNNGSLMPTNFCVGQIAVGAGSNQTPVLGAPPAFAGTIIDPPLWLGGTNAITDPNAWPPWADSPEAFPHWPLAVTNADGAVVIVPEAQRPFWNPSHFAATNPVFALQALPGTYAVESTSDLSQPWIHQSAIEVGADGTAAFTPAFGDSLFLRLSGAGPSRALGYNLRIQTLGNSFQPAIYCYNNTPQDFLWTWSDGTTSPDFPIASKNFGSHASRFQNLRVYLPDSITAINLGFDGSDGGENTPLTNRPPQNVGAVYFPYPLEGLKYWGCSYNPITNTLDFTGFSSLEAIECFHCTNLQHAVVSHLPSLKRVCFEECNLGELNLTGDLNIADVRAALNAFTNVSIGGGAGSKIWHWCIRDNPQLTQDFSKIMTNFSSLQELWIWDDNQSGALTFVSTSLTDVEIENNFYEFADFTDQTNLLICWSWDNQLTNLVVNGCIRLQELKAQNNQLPGHVLDAILAFLDASAPDIQLVDLSGNASLPSVAGYAHYSGLTNRGVVVYIDFPGPDAPKIVFDSSALTAEGCMPANGAIDPGEIVTVSFAFRNIGTLDTTNLVITLLETNGVVGPSGSQVYGVLPAGGLAVTQSFTFTATGYCGGLTITTLQLQDGSTDLGVLSIPFTLGQAISVFAQDFDSVTAPELPPGWSTMITGAQLPWATTNTTADTPANSAIALDIPDPGLSDLVSPPIVLPNGLMQLSFRNNYDLEPDLGDTADDGGVLEIQIGTNSFTDILDAGGTFLIGGYNRTITNIYGNPLAGRLAWSGNSGGYITTIVNLPVAAEGQTIQLRWRCATDNGNSSGNLAGWHIDTIAITGRNCCTNAP